jgi:hypothetical protein
MRRGPEARACSTSADPSLGDGCVAYDAAFDLAGPRGALSATAIGVVRCPGMCPRAGVGALALPRGASATWTYGGDATASLEVRGRTFEVALACDP